MEKVSLHNDIVESVLEGAIRHLNFECAPICNAIAKVCGNRTSDFWRRSCHRDLKFFTKNQLEQLKSLQADLDFHKLYHFRPFDGDIVPFAYRNGDSWKIVSTYNLYDDDGSAKLFSTYDPDRSATIMWNLDLEETPFPTGFFSLVNIPWIKISSNIKANSRSQFTQHFEIALINGDGDKIDGSTDLATWGPLRPFDNTPMEVTFSPLPLGTKVITITICVDPLSQPTSDTLQIETPLITLGQP